ncbi:MAG: zf-HC2 domain-containing protein [Comamonadaceae bacterium]|nr:MAG: zf-HC2 domain-containing protein [Comamonadaceae bacterium]
MSAAAFHLSCETLLDYWLRETDPATTERVDEHLMQCDACGEELDRLVALGEGVRGAFREGFVMAVASDAFLRQLGAQGLRIREYRLPPEGSVNCTVAPDDDVLVTRLEAPLQGVSRLDAVAHRSTEPGVQHRLEDLPFEETAGEVLYISPVTQVRQLPAHTMELTLLAVGEGGTRELGRYTFHHSPWPGATGAGR